MHLFLDGILKISERSVEPARSLEREIYVRQEAKVLPWMEQRVRSLFLIVPCNVYVMSSACFLFYIFKYR